MALDAVSNTFTVDIDLVSMSSGFSADFLIDAWLADQP